MQYAVLAIITLTLSAQNVFRKQYDVKSRGGVRFTHIFNLIATVAALLFFVCSNGFDFTFELGTLWYSIGFAVSYAAAIIFNLLAIQCGSLALTSLFISYSLLVPTVWGIVFLNEETSPLLFCGIAMLIVSIFLVGMRGASSEGRKPITARWVVYIVLAFAGNGMCSTMQKLHQVRYPGLYGTEMMSSAMAIVVVILAVLVLSTRRGSVDRYSPARDKSMLWAIPCGIANGVTNYLVLTLQTVLPASVMYPTISAGSIVATFIVAITLYKERQTVWQIAGFVIGVAAVVLLNI